MTITHTEIAAAYDRLHAPVGATASAAKRGRNPAFPYVPVVASLHLGRVPVTHNPLKGFAFATREEAVACAQRCIDDQRAIICAHMAEPRYRALREQYGLPRELEGGV